MVKIPINPEWEKARREIQIKLGLTYKDWCWLIDKLQPFLKKPK